MRYLRELVLPHTAMKTILEPYFQGIDAAHARGGIVLLGVASLHDGWARFVIAVAPSALQEHSTGPTKNRRRSIAQSDYEWFRRIRHNGTSGKGRTSTGRRSESAGCTVDGDLGYHVACDDPQ